MPLKGRDGDRINAVLAAAGYNFGLLLRWLQRLLRALLRMLLAIPAPARNPQRTLLIGSSRTTNFALAFAQARRCVWGVLPG